MILRQAVDVVLERVETRRSDDPGLPHRPAEHVLVATGGLDERRRPGQHRSDRRAQPLRQVDPDRIDLPGELRRARAAGDDRVHQARAIHVHRDAVLRGQRPDRGERVQRPDRAAAVIRGVLDRDQPGFRGVRATGGEELGDVVSREPAARRVDRLQQHIRQHRRTARLGGGRVGAAVENDRVAPAGMNGKRDGVAHRSRWQEECRFLAGQRGDMLLQGVDGWVLADLLVTDRRAGHRLPHGLAGPRGGIAGEIDHGAGDSSTDSRIATPPSYSPSRQMTISLSK